MPAFTKRDHYKTQYIPTHAPRGTVCPYAPTKPSLKGGGTSVPSAASLRRLLAGRPITHYPLSGRGEPPPYCQILVPPLSKSPCLPRPTHFDPFKPSQSRWIPVREVAVIPKT